ncbi:PREDICTED: agamous-like MADS-box protein AGL62 [Ipomoea nil]|uniref:agamous-like MADS-box protein AGL62 n=1 Tax=Ipomoea nil TaxID=35883 RepID=UPI000900B2F8|nr:PREDICTED: agamous-like MADS-box protein AGL62 [Ipomoea nil]
MAKRPSMGRQKIKIEKIEIKNHLQVTFSKRRSGLFKKASELCILCGVEVAIIVFSPAGKVFSFGHPNVDPIIDRFLSRNHHHPAAATSNANANATLHLVEAHRSAAVREMNLQLTQMTAESEIERKRGEALDLMRKESRSRCWWEAPVSELRLPELEQLRDAMDELKKNVAAQAESIMAEAVNTSTFLAMNGTAAAAGIFDPPETKPPQRIMANNTHNHHHALHDFGYDLAFS